MYKIICKKSDSPLYIFKTDYGLTYTVSFHLMDFDNDYFNNLYSVDFIEINNSKHIKDDLIEITICEIISIFLEENPTAILHYLCDVNDGKGEFRSRLFSRWYNKVKNKIHNKLVINYNTIDFTYALEFIFIDDHYNINELAKKVNEQMNEFSKEK